MKTLLLLSAVPMAFFAPFVAVTMLMALLATHLISTRRRVIVDKMMVEARHADAQRKATLNY